MAFPQGQLALTLQLILSAAFAPRDEGYFAPACRQAHSNRIPPPLSTEVRRIGDRSCLQTARSPTFPIYIDLRRSSHFGQPHDQEMAGDPAGLTACDDPIDIRVNGIDLPQLAGFRPSDAPYRGCPLNNMSIPAFIYNNYSFVKCFSTGQIWSYAVERAMALVVLRNPERGAWVAARGMCSASNGPLRSATFHSRLRARTGK